MCVCVSVFVLKSFHQKNEQILIVYHITFNTISMITTRRFYWAFEMELEMIIGFRWMFDAHAELRDYFGIEANAQINY